VSRSRRTTAAVVSGSDGPARAAVYEAVLVRLDRRIEV